MTPAELRAQVKIIRVPLDDLPSWAQEKIISTGLGLLEDESAYAVSNCGTFDIYAHGYRYRVSKLVPFVY